MDRGGYRAQRGPAASLGVSRRDLPARACDVTWERDRRKVWYVLFSISGFSDELCDHAAARDDLLLIDDRE